MSVRDDAPNAGPAIKRSWSERLILPMLIVGGVLTLSWILALMSAVWRIAGALAGAPG